MFATFYRARVVQLHQMRINNFVLDFGEDSLFGKRVLSSEASRGCTWTGLQLKVKKAAERRLTQPQPGAHPWCVCPTIAKVLNVYSETLIQTVKRACVKCTQ
jgi:hypothetical protein